MEPPAPEVPGLAEPVPAIASLRSDLSSLARGGALNLVGSLAGGALSFLLAVVVTRGLHPAGAGVFFEAVALFTILANTCEVGADTGLVRGVSRALALDRG
ncbi:MAG TPA: hypothetical protein VGR13_08565, partial [Actinomycetota bacterium]|nr:hypothetical protein [Actinomycetota bacterium]